MACHERLKTSIEGLSLFPVAKRVKQAISKIRKKTRLHKGHLTVNRADFDCSCWQLDSKDSSQLRLMSYAQGLKARKRICLTILGQGLLRGTIKLIKERTGYELRVSHAISNVQKVKL